MNTNNKYVCIHGHFYQPPRENAWLEVVELQDSARPFHDWNARINFECYAMNTAARILDDDGYIIKILNNYSRINFNFGPTLLSWMEHADPTTYQSILEADKLSMKRFNGHGSAIAQVHSHLILPLANDLDKETQVIWGIKDFESRFGRMPEGMWLAETAANTETLEVLAEQGIKYTILAPRQGKAIRRIGDEHWHELPHDSIETRRPYRCFLPSGKTIDLFFYNGEVAQDVAFNGLLNNGKDFARRFVHGFDDNDEVQIVHIATDGESYGHHHRYGEMALADCINHIETNNLAQLTNYGEYLEKFPPEYEVQIYENSSWSCVHGVERWRSNCGCNSGGNHGWTQEWRSHLRSLLNWVRDELIPIYETEAGKLLKDPWAARNDYIEVILDRSEEKSIEFIKRHAKRKLSDNQEIKLYRLMEMQRNAMLMFTSCGWFFDEISGLETNQILQYALRAMAYAKQIAKVDLHDEFIERLQAAPSNVFKNGAMSYQNNVMPAQVNLVRVAMHYAASSLFEENIEKIDLFNYNATSELFDKIEAGNMKLAVGRTTIKSKITHSKKNFSFAVLYLGQQNMYGTISTDMGRTEFNRMHREMNAAFRSTNLGNVIGLMQHYFGEDKFTIWHLFRDEKRKIIRQISKKSLRQSEQAFREIYNDNFQLMRGMLQSSIPVPSAFKSAAQYIINTDLHRFFLNEILDIKRLKTLANELREWGIGINNEQSFKLTASERLFYEIRKLAYSDTTVDHLNLLNEIFETLQMIGVDLDIWKSQNLYFSMMKAFENGERKFKDAAWREAFLKLGGHLKIRMIFEPIEV